MLLQSLTTSSVVMQKSFSFSPLLVFPVLLQGGLGVWGEEKKASGRLDDTNFKMWFSPSRHRHSPLLYEEGGASVEHSMGKF